MNSRAAKVIPAALAVLLFMVLVVQIASTAAKRPLLTPTLSAPVVSQTPIPASPTPVLDGGITVSWTKILTGFALGVDWSPDGASVVLDDLERQQIDLINWQTGALIWQTPFPLSAMYGQAIPTAFSARWSRDGHWIAATAAGKLYLIEPATGKIIPFQPALPPGRGQPVYVLARWGTDSVFLAVLDNYGYIDVLATTTGKITQTITLTDSSYADISAFDWNPDGQRFAAAYLKAPLNTDSVGFWDRQGNLLKAYTQESLTDSAPATPCTQNASDLTAGGFSDFEWARDNQTLAVGLTNGLTICTLNNDGTITDQDLPLRGATFHWSPDQRWLAGASSKQSAIWIADPAQAYQTVLVQPPGDSTVNSVAWSPDSQQLAVGTTHQLWIGTFHEPEAAATPAATSAGS
ncbi:MAG TPA: WD40 repeat domain-containing protein [Phototrophicaceae bacterium]|nr:WD40 repeat domain-containing protein [Phototrophicaceae bacterium]